MEIALLIIANLIMTTDVLTVNVDIILEEIENVSQCKMGALNIQEAFVLDALKTLDFEEANAIFKDVLHKELILKPDLFVSNVKKVLIK
jgi:hypothetical protein